MRKSLLLVFSLIILSVVGTTIYGFAADKETTIKEQAAKPVQESQDIAAEDSETLKEEAATPATYSAVITDEVARGNDSREELPQAVETPATNEVAVEIPVEEPVITVDVPPAQELEIDVPDDWDTFISGDTAPVDETIE